MVKTFRVLELQQLLRSARQSPKGRKAVLVDRVLSLIDQGVSLPIQLKIKRLHQKLFPHLYNRAVSLPLSHTSLSGNNGIHSNLSQIPVQRTSGSNGCSNRGSSNSGSSGGGNSGGNSGSMNSGSSLGVRGIGICGISVAGSSHSGVSSGSSGISVAGSSHSGVSSGSSGISVAGSSHSGVSNGGSGIAVAGSTGSHSDVRDSGSNGIGSSQMLQHPDVRLKCLPLYDQLDEILKPFALVSCKPAQQQEMQVNFQLSRQQQLDILMSSFTLSSLRLAFPVQVQLRFCLYGNSNQLPDCFPPGICVKVNGLTAQLPNLIPAKVRGAEPKRPNGPLDITRQCNITADGKNVIDISWSIDQGKQYYAALYLVKKLDSNALLTRLQKSGISKPEQTKQMIKEKLSLDCDSEISTTSLCVSLLCPIGKVRMTVPCRGGLCDHLQCFDALTFLRMNEQQKSSWICPVCDRSAEYDQLIIDGLFREIITDCPTATEIELTKDGQWRITKGGEVDGNAPHQSDKPDKPIEGSSGCNDISVIDLTETDGIDLTESRPAASSAIPTASATLDSQDSTQSSCPPRSHAVANPSAHIHSQLSRMFHGLINPYFHRVASQLEQYRQNSSQKQWQDGSNKQQ